MAAVVEGAASAAEGWLAAATTALEDIRPVPDTKDLVGKGLCLGAHGLLPTTPGRGWGTENVVTIVYCTGSWPGSSGTHSA